MNFAGLFTYLSASPFLFQDVYGFSPQQYGLLFGVNSLGIVAGVQTSSRLIRKVPPQWILACSTAWMFLMAVLIVIFDQLGFGLWGVMVPLWFYILGAGFTFPCVQVLALAKHGAQAGTAASLLGAATFLMAGLVSPVVGWFGVTLRHPDGRRPGRVHLPGRGRPLAGRQAPHRPAHPVARHLTAACPPGPSGHMGTMSTRQPQGSPLHDTRAPVDMPSLRGQEWTYGHYVHAPAPARGMSPRLARDAACASPRRTCPVAAARGGHMGTMSTRRAPARGMSPPGRSPQEGHVRLGRGMSGAGARRPCSRSTRGR